MKELVIVPVEGGFENILDNPAYLKVDLRQYNVAGYLYFYRRIDSRHLVCRRIPYSHYHNTKNMLVVSLISKTSSRYMMLHVYKDIMHRTGSYYRSSYRNYCYDSNRVNY